MLSDYTQWQLLQSKTVSDREKFLSLGSSVCSPGLVILYNELLNDATFSKVYLKVDGWYEITTAPISMLVGTNDWRWWRIGTNHLHIGYDSKATKINAWWDCVRSAMHGQQDKVPQMYGDIVLFRWNDSLSWTELDARRELINALVCRYLRKTQYKFSW